MPTETRIQRQIDYLNEITGSCDMFDFARKEYAHRQHINYMFARTHSMFEWGNLPDTLPERYIELYLQMRGHACFYEYKDDLYIFLGGFGGVPDAYYMPTKYIIDNPALGLHKEVVINKDCIIMPNDSMYLGLYPLFSRYSSAMVENELSLKIAMENSRIIELIGATDDRTYKSAVQYLEDVKLGKSAVIGESEFFDGIRATPYGNTANSNTLTNLLEVEQYLKASWYNELGLNANYNMKRESINAGESQLNNDALLPLVDDMLKNRQEAVEKVNAMFGTDITVKLASSWEDNEQEINAEHGGLSGQPENGGENEEQTE